jgi:hypothetical protein
MVNTQHLVTSYLAAQRQHHEAARLMARAERNLDRMIEHGVDEDRAYLAAGVGLADRRCLKTYAKVLRARRLLETAMR